jgi:hypothetical protein
MAHKSGVSSLFRSTQFLTLKKSKKASPDSAKKNEKLSFILNNKILGYTDTWERTCFRKLPSTHHLSAGGLVTLGIEFLGREARNE